VSQAFQAKCARKYINKLIAWSDFAPVGSGERTFGANVTTDLATPAFGRHFMILDGLQRGIAQNTAHAKRTRKLVGN
jgi:hypothetical protein